MTLENKETEKEEHKVKEVHVSSVYDEVFEESVIAKPEKTQQIETPIKQLVEEEHIDPEPVLVEEEAYQTTQLVEEPILESSKPLTTGSRKQLINDDHADILDYDSETNELSDRLGESPISDLTKASSCECFSNKSDTSIDGNCISQIYLSTVFLKCISQHYFKIQYISIVSTYYLIQTKT
mgnify:CR=1 FL=1